MQYRWVVESPASDIISRQSVFEPLQTGILSIDSMIPLARGKPDGFHAFMIFTIFKNFRFQRFTIFTISDLIRFHDFDFFHVFAILTFS